MKLTIDAAALAKAAKLAAAIVEKRNTVPILSNALLALDGDALTIRATDLDCELSITLPCAGLIDGALTVPAYELADLARAAAKQKGAQIGLTAGDGKLALVSGRSEFSLNALPRDDFPLFAAWEAAESWEGDAADYADMRADGVTMGESTPKKFGKVAKYVGVTSAQFTRRDTDGAADRYRMECHANAPGAIRVTFEAKLAPPMLGSWKPARPSRFTFGSNAAAETEAASYLRTMRATLGLPLIGEGSGRLIVTDGRAVGMTFGECRRDYNESREMPADWAPPAGTVIEPVQWCEGATQCEVDGVEYSRMHDGAAWSQRHVAPVPGAILWDAGAYSLPMPADMRRAVSALTVDVDGVAMPLAADWRGDISREIALSADEIADLCGPVDPSTFVEIPALAFHQGHLLASGEAAVRFNSLQAAHVKRLRKIAKAPRTPERLERYAAECEAFAPVIAALIDGADVLDAAIEAAGGLPREEAPAVPVALCEFKPAGPGFHIAVISPAAPEPAADAPAVPEPLCDGPCGVERRQCEQFGLCRHIEEAEAAKDEFFEKERAALLAGEPFPLPPYTEAAADPCEDDDERLVQLLADCAPAVAAPAVPDAMERRLARLEAALGLVDTPKRSPAHAAAIRRAWFFRRAQRNARAWALSEVAQKKCAQDKAAALQGQLNSDCQRLATIEATIADERAELVAEIDRLRGALERESDGLEANARRAMQLSASRRRVVARALKLRRDVARTRAERDGLAANLQAMSRRVASDASLIERLQPAGVERPRFILNAR